MARSECPSLDDTDMSDDVELSSILRTAMRLASVQRVDDALHHLAEGLAAAKRSGLHDEIQVIARVAAVLCSGNGRLREAAAYYEEAASVDSQDPCTQWALGDVYSRLGEDILAKEHWDRFTTIASTSADRDVREIFEAHIERTLEGKKP